MIKAVIFDMDGVLADTQPLHFEVDLLTLKKLGIDATLEIVEKYAGMTNHDRWTKYKKDFFIRNPIDEIVFYHTEILKNLMNECDLDAIDGIPQLIQKIKSEKLKVAVASSSSYDFIYRLLEKIQLKNCFDEIVSGEDMKRGKPFPDIFIKTSEALEVAPEECIVIEDSGNGVLAAKAANMKCIAFVNKNSGNQDLTPADIIVTSFFDVEIQ